MTRDDVATFVLDRLQIASSESAKVTQVNTIIQQEVYRLNEEYNLTMASASATIAANTGLVTLPSDVQKVVSLTQTTVTVDIVDEQNWATRVAAIAAGTSPSITNPPTIAVYRPPSTLATLPIPTSNVTATLVYVQRPPLITTGSTVLQIPLEYHDLVAETACWRMALTEGEIFIARFTNEVVQDLRARLSGLRTMAPGQAGWAIPLQGYPSGS
jgi:hypothetical protein